VDDVELREAGHAETTYSQQVTNEWASIVFKIDEEDGTEIRSRFVYLRILLGKQQTKKQKKHKNRSRGDG